MAQAPSDMKTPMYLSARMKQLEDSGRDCVAKGLGLWKDEPLVPGAEPFKLKHRAAPTAVLRGGAAPSFKSRPREQESPHGLLVTRLREAVRAVTAPQNRLGWSQWLKFSCSCYRPDFKP